MKHIAAVMLAGGLFSAQAPCADLTISVLTDVGSQPVAGAVVYLANAGGTVAPVSGEVVQKDRQFHPKVLVIPKGSRVEFPNQDNTQHHVYSFSPAKTFNIELYAGKPEAPVVFDKAGIVEIGCNIHDHMQGFIVVTETAAFGTTDAQGEVTLPLGALPLPDTIDLKLWHPRLPDNTQAVTRTVPPGSLVTVAISLAPVPAGSGPLELLQQRFREIE